MTVLLHPSPTTTTVRKQNVQPHVRRLLLRLLVCVSTLTYIQQYNHSAVLLKFETTVIENNQLLHALTANSIINNNNTNNGSNDKHHGVRTASLRTRQTVTIVSSNVASASNESRVVQNSPNPATTSEASHKNQSVPSIVDIEEPSVKNNSSLPSWLQEYIEWHYETMSNLTESNWQEQKYFLLRCVKGDHICDGASDRLKTIPVMLRLARNSNRLFFIHWSRPARIEEFLVPSGKLNWTVPEWLAPKLDVEATSPVWKFDSSKANSYVQRTDTVIRVKNILYASDLYDAHILPGEETMWMAYHDIWDAVFKPSPNVQREIDKQMQSLGLVPHHYIAAHVRAVYAKNITEQPTEINALHCAVQLIQNNNSTDLTADWPIYMASDSLDVKLRAIRYGQDHGIRVVGSLNQTEPLHLDRGRDFLAESEDWKNRPPSDFYDTFVDLYMLALAGGTTSGMGGFGSWGTVIGTAFHGNLWNNHERQKCRLPPSPQSQSS